MRSRSGLILIGTVRAKLPGPRKTKTRLPPGLLPKPRGHLRGFPFTASGPPSRRPGHRRSPKSEFQFSSATRRVDITPLSRPRGAQSERLKVVAAQGWLRGVGRGGGAVSPHPAARMQEKKKARGWGGDVGFKSQNPGKSTTRYKQSQTGVCKDSAASK